MLYHFFLPAHNDHKAKGAKEDDERKKEKMQEAIEEQRHREKQEEWVKRKMNENQSGTAPTPESSKVCGFM